MKLSYMHSKNKMKKTISIKKLKKIWQQVPTDYYQKATIQRWWHAQKFETFKKLVGNRRFNKQGLFLRNKILDVGCASGEMTNKISRISPKAQITAVDIYKEAIFYGKKHYPHIKFLVADAHKLPFKNNSFDLVVCYETIEHLTSPKKALKEVRRVMKDNGTAIVAMDSGSTLFCTIWWFWEKTFGRAWQGAHLHPFHHRELEELILSCDFAIKKKHFSHFGMEVSFVLKK